MAKKICRNIYYMYAGEIGLGAWKLIPLKADATLQMQTKEEDAGYIDENTLTASMCSDPDFPLIRQPEKFVILRAATDDGREIIIGTYEYPARLEYSDDGIVAKLTFRQSQPHGS